MFRILVILLLILPVASGILAENHGLMAECEIIIDDFANGIKPAWRPKSFKGSTEYTWTKEDNRAYIRAESKGSASGLYYKIEYNPRQYQYITWQWRVDNIIAGGDATRKSGDDYGARVYVVFPSFFFWKTRAINYIWANKLPKGEVLPNSYTSNSVMISVESGNSESGKWITETRNVYEDYKRFFGQEPADVGAIAIMTDTDNTGESASAGYGPIAVCSRDPRR
ncbi:MAG: hypothetical protein AMJ60_02405 [Desulfobacterales bacterium SG8_35]|nr:MAG: hypothetical protein AMJ60_02405 [Desulfobacterales bacterium SG8_35]